MGSERISVAGREADGDAEDRHRGEAPEEEDPRSELRVADGELRELTGARLMREAEGPLAELEMRLEEPRAVPEPLEGAGKRGRERALSMEGRLEPRVMGALRELELLAVRRGAGAL